MIYLHLGHVHAVWSLGLFLRSEPLCNKRSVFLMVLLAARARLVIMVEVGRLFLKRIKLKLSSIV